MKNVVMKNEHYKDYGMFNHIYFLDVNYDFNEKSVEEIVEKLKTDPFSPVMIHINNIPSDLVKLLKKLSETITYVIDDLIIHKEIWLKFDNLLFENIIVKKKEVIELLGLDKVDVLIDSLGDEIDLKKSLKFDTFIKYDYIHCPF